MSKSLASAGAFEAPLSEEKLAYRKVTLRLIPVLFLCYVLNYVDRLNVGFAQLQMRTDLGFSDAVYGLGVGLFFIGYLFFEVPSNLLLERVGARKTLLRIMVLWGLASTATMFVTSAWQFYLVRFLVGAAEAGFLPGILLYLTYWFPAKHRGRITAMFIAALPVAGIVGGPISGWIMHSMDGVGGWLCGRSRPGRMAVAIPAGRYSVGRRWDYCLFLSSGRSGSGELVKPPRERHHQGERGCRSKSP